MTRAILPLAAAALATLALAVAPAPAAALATLALAVAPAPAAAQTAAVSGEAAYAENCAACHRTPARFMRRYTAMAPAKRQADLDKFLTGHYAPDPTTRTAIIAWLEANHTGK